MGTRAVLKRAEGGVLFLDNAYHLYRPNNPRDYGVEVVELLLQYMENCRADFVVVFSGYKPHMQRFFKSNPGLASRVRIHVDFPGYTTLDLMLIANLFSEEKNYVISRELSLLLWIYFDFEKAVEGFANARTVEFFMGRLMLSHARAVFRGVDDDQELMKGLLTVLSGGTLFALLCD